jgi:hypothetical protein
MRIFYYSFVYINKLIVKVKKYVPSGCFTLLSIIQFEYTQTPVYIAETVFRDRYVRKRK